MLITVIGCVVIGAIIYLLNKKYCILALCARVKRIDGGDLNEVCPVIPGKTIFGNNFDILNMDAEHVFNYVQNCVKYSGGKSFIWHFMESAVYNVCRAEEAEAVLNSQQLITKGVIYHLLETFLGFGLLTSTDKKWHSRRKLLTPAFHFNVLQSFAEIFKEESSKFLKAIDESPDGTLSLRSIIPKFTLDNICETAMGVKLDSFGSEGDEYRCNILRFEHLLVKRSCNPLYYYEIVFRTFGDSKTYYKHLEKIHDFRSNVINKRRAEFLKNSALHEDVSDYVGRKKRYAMLDTLLDAETKGLIDHKGICEEVDTFMFEGFDTTSTCLIFALINLALHQDVQEKCYDEVNELDDIESLTVFDFNKLEYLECVIKETLRLFPSVPLFSRECKEETRINGLILPKSTQIQFHTYTMHRDPKHFPDPEKFDPTRFLPENTTNRHPFAFLPFSAGPRNCIGQKFAMLEIKVLLTSILKNYRLLPVTRLEDISFEYGLVLRTVQDVTVKAVKR